MNSIIESSFNCRWCLPKGSHRQMVSFLKKIWFSYFFLKDIYFESLSNFKLFYDEDGGIFFEKTGSGVCLKKNKYYFCTAFGKQRCYKG